MKIFGIVSNVNHLNFNTPIPYHTHTLRLDICCFQVVTNIIIQYICQFVTYKSKISFYASSNYMFI